MVEKSCGMSFTRRFIVVQLAPPLLIAFPAALLFLRHVMAPPPRLFWTILFVAAAAYLAGALIFAMVVGRAARAVERLVAAKGDASDAVSRCMHRTEFAAVVLWIGWGLILALAGSAMLLRTFLGIQYFAETALIIATPAMAWSYWTGKHMLVDFANGAIEQGYTGRTWSVGAKITMVFLGFFVVSVGAIVLFVSSRIAQTLGEEAAFSIAGFALGVALATSAFFAAATYFLARDITSPMGSLVSVAQAMADGRFDVEPRIFSDDQVGILARAFATTRHTLRSLIGRVRSSGGVITEGVATMTAGTRSLISGAHEQTGLVKESTMAVARVRDEARSVLEDVERVTEKTADSASRAAELRASFAEVRRRTDELFQSVEKSSSAANEISATAREMERRTMELSGVGSDLLAFVAEMDASVAEITRTADATAAISSEVRDSAIDGGEAVEATVREIRSAQESTRRTVDAFDALQKSLGQIDQVLEFIDELTKKTNLLSLNAAIVAAHAGHGDFGFSVIADEVRQLSDRTRGATKEISGIIRNVRPVTLQALDALEEGARTVDSTVGLAQKASNALTTILEHANRSLGMTRGMSRSLQDQASASRHLHQVTAQMSDNIGEMHRGTAAQAEATRLLAAEAELVHDIARHVKRATEEQTVAEDGIARAMESIAGDVRTIRDRLGNQLEQTQQIAANSNDTLTIAQRNNGVAEEFGVALGELLRQGEEFATAVARFRG